MQPAGHSETAERKEVSPRTRGVTLSKMTNHKQEARCDNIFEELKPLISHCHK
jgi:hypothetical protein